MAEPTDITGHQIFQASSSSVAFPLSQAPAQSFQEWIQQLPAAEHRLISTTSFALCDAEKLLLQYLQIECTIHIGTSGDHKHPRGAFAWIICSPGREHLVLNTGPVDGWHKCQSSLRSAIAALASVTLYLDEIVTFYSLTIKCKFKLYADSSSAICSAATIRDLIPKRKVANHEDLLSIIRAAPVVISRFHFCHEPRNQDIHTDFDQLLFSAQLTATCTRMAIRHLTNEGVSDSERTQSCAPCPRHLPVEVFLGSQNVSSYYIPRIRDEITSRNHRAFLQTKYNWTDKITATIAWESFSLCGYRTRNDKASTRSKLVHNWLNLGAQRAKHGAAQSLTLRECPYCALPEDFVHLLSCRSPHATKSRYDAVTILKKALGDSAGNISIFRAITQWTMHPTINPTLPSSVPSFQTAIDSAVHSQSDIGWTNLFRGLISESWGDITNSAVSPTSREDRSSQATNHLARTIRALQDYSLNIWKSRNEFLHRNEDHGNAILMAQLHQEITTIYSIRDTFSPIIQSYFSKSLEDRLLCSRRQKHRWLRLVRIATAHATSKGSRQQVMSSYFAHTLTTHTVPPTMVAMPPGPLPPLISTLQQVPIRQYLTGNACESATLPD